MVIEKGELAEGTAVLLAHRHVYRVYAVLEAVLGVRALHGVPAEVAETTRFVALLLGFELLVLAGSLLEVLLALGDRLLELVLLHEVVLFLEVPI